MTESGDEQLIRVPGSKSIANRALICAVLAEGQSNISNCAPGDDTQAMLESLETLGVKTVQDGTTVRINSQISFEATEPRQLQTRLAGTTSRFLTALCSLRAGQTTIDGYEPLRNRPMNGLHDALLSLGDCQKFEYPRTPSRSRATGKFVAGTHRDRLDYFKSVHKCVDDDCAILARRS